MSTSSYLFVLFSVIMVMNLTILKTAPSFYNTAFFFVILALTPRLKTTKQNVLFALSMIYYEPFYFKPQCHQNFGPKLCTQPPFYLTSVHPKQTKPTLPISLFFFAIPTTPTYEFLVVFAFSSLPTMCSYWFFF
jgi:hypothetical protein